MGLKLVTQYIFKECECKTLLFFKDLDVHDIVTNPSNMLLTQCPTCQKYWHIFEAFRHRYYSNLVHEAVAAQNMKMHTKEDNCVVVEPIAVKPTPAGYIFNDHEMEKSFWHSGIHTTGCPPIYKEYLDEGIELANNSKYGSAEEFII